MCMRLLTRFEQLFWFLPCCALILTSIDGLPVVTARFTFAMARHVIVDLDQALNISPPTAVNRLSSTELGYRSDEVKRI